MLARRVDGVIRGSVEVVGNMTEGGCVKDLHWGSKVVRAVLGGVGRRRNILQNYNNLTSRFVSKNDQGFEK